MLERLFGLRSHGTTVPREILAGTVTFLTMAYIAVVQPAVLSQDFRGDPTGLNADGVYFATCVSAATASLVMGLYANLPVALASGMGQNFFFVSVLVALGEVGFADPAATALGIVFVSGLLFWLVSLLGAREAILHALSDSLRCAIAGGIGLFVAFIGLKNAGLIEAAPGTLVRLRADLWNTETAVWAAGLLATVTLFARRVRGAVLWGIAVAALVATIAGRVHWPSQWVGMPDWHALELGRLDLAGVVRLQLLPIVLIFLYMDLFDTLGTLVAVSEEAGLMQDGRLPNARRALMADAFGTVWGAWLGTSTVTSYIESAAGVEEGGRTGLTACVTGLWFLLALPLTPLVRTLGSFAPITAPALVFVGLLMARNIARIRWDDITEAAPAALTVLGIPLCFSIGDGLALGMVSYPLIKLLAGRGRDVPWLMYVLGVALGAYLLLVRSQWSAHLGL
ncbi:MAG: NCS2 family permease [Planctomycetota bacterium]|nr:MAG: NCS2 family permease [Planctomycetota bacterium]